MTWLFAFGPPVKQSPAKPKRTLAKAKQKAVVSSQKAGTSSRLASDRKAKFVDAYLANNGNITQAAITAGYSAKTASQAGNRLFRDVQVSALIEKRRQELLAESKLTTDEIHQDLARTLRFDPRKIFREDGSMLPVHQLPDDVAMCLTGIEVVSSGTADAPTFTHKLKWESKTAARDQASRMHGLYELDNRQKSPLDGMPREFLMALIQRLKSMNAKEAKGNIGG